MMERSRRDLLAAIPLLAAWNVLGHPPNPASTRGAYSGAGGARSHAGAIVLLGASYAAGWRLPEIVGRAVVNKGTPGQESWELLQRFERDVIAPQPQAVILWGYINDIFRSPREEVDRAMRRAQETFETMVTRARAADIEVIVATEVTIRPPSGWSETFSSWIGWAMGKESYQAYINARVMSLNDWLRGFAERDHLLLLDLQSILADASGQRASAFASEDGSHITPAGYARLTEYAVPVLEAHFRSPRP